MDFDNPKNCGTLKPMTNATLVKKVRDIEIELENVKRVLKTEPDFAVDEKNWKKVQPTVRKLRTKLYREQYGKR